MKRITIFDRNKFEKTPCGIEIVCFNRRGDESGRCLIDESDLPLVKDRKWRYWKGRFFTGNYRPIQIHTFLTGAGPNEVVDHINGDASDNRRANLRVTTQDNNCINKGIQKNNKSGIAGVPYDKSRKCWAPEISRSGIRIHLGRYKDFCNAVFARYTAETVMFGEYRSTRNDEAIVDHIAKCTESDKERIREYVENKIKRKASQCEQNHVSIAPSH